VDLHNYAAANSTQQKLINWGLLNRKIFIRFGMNLPEPVMRGICLGRAGLVEVFLYNLRTKIDDYLYGMETNPSDPQYRVLHQKAKTSDVNTTTPRQNQQYTPRLEQNNYGNEYAPKYPNAPSSQVFYYEQDPAQKSRMPGGNMQKKSTSMNSLSTDMVSRIEYDEKEQECMAKDEQIQVNLCVMRMSII
jgi:hypothetical protein